MANKDIAYARLRNQRIAWMKEETSGDVAQRLGALQAQDYTQALWAVGVRMHHATAAKIEQDIADKKIVLSWAMRGTLHIVPAKDLSWMLRLLTPRILAKAASRQRQLEIDSALLKQCEKLFYRALKEEKRLTRRAIMERLEQAGIATKNGRGYHLLWHLAQEGLLCFGPMEEKQQTFVLLEDWVQSSTPLSAQEALGELANRYFTGHGPATVHDFAWWSGLTIKESREGVEAARSRLSLEKYDGMEYWTGRDHVMESNEQPVVCLLPGFDEYLLGYKDREAVLETTYAPLIVPGQNGVFSPMLVIDGEIAGTWKREIKKRGVSIAVHAFNTLGSRKEHIDEAARRYCEFLDLPLSELVFYD